MEYGSGRREWFVVGGIILLLAALLGCGLFFADRAGRARADDGADGSHGLESLPPPEERAELPPDGGEEYNRLIHESSPYLLQHADNPVDWHPWSDEAFEAARERDVPVFLSIGYSTCHWCHVMERESFEDPEVAAYLNETFVPVKVDREERPDVDAVYMDAVRAMTGRGGWPLSVFLTPDREPFFGGTYFPPEGRFGRPGFRDLLERIDELWTNDRETVLTGARQVVEHLESSDRGLGEAELDEETLALAFDRFSSTFDGEHGGFGRAPKFPQPHTHLFLLRHHHRTGSERALEMVRRTLGEMARGGVRDHLGGGFHRYSTDREWLLPHFEKMLYDQALLARAYVELHQVTGEDRWADVARSTYDHVLRDMTGETGAFFSARDADSEGEEGLFYLWTRDEVIEVLGPDDGELFCSIYGLTDEGNFVEEASRQRTGRNILHLDRPLAEVAEERAMAPASLERRLAGMRERLFDVRSGRVHPALDDKVLADWNALMIGSLARAGRILGEERYLEAARSAADHVLDEMVRDDGRLLHRWRNGEAAVPAFLADHAYLVEGLLDLWEATFEVRWLEAADRLARAMIRLFADPDEGGFYQTGTDGEVLFTRRKEVQDMSRPSGNSVAAHALLRLGRLTVSAELEERGRETMEAFSGRIARRPTAHAYVLLALDRAVGPAREIVLAGDLDDPTVRAMERTLAERHLPRAVLAHRPPGDAPPVVGLAPFLEGLVPIDGRPTAYVCQDYACDLPVHDAEALSGQLDD